MTAIFTSTDRSSPSFYPASQTALLLLDFQPFTIAQCPSGPSAVSQAQKLLNWARSSNNILIIHSIVNLSSEIIPPTTKNSERLKSYIETLSEDPNNSSIPPELTPLSSSSEVILLKTPGIVSALSMPDVRQILEDRGIKSLVLAGLSTSGAVMRTATQGTDEGFVVCVVEDACGDRTEEVHEVVVKKVLENRCHVCGVGGWIGEWEGRIRG